MTNKIEQELKQGGMDSMKPKFNKQTGKYEVEAFGKTHEFDDKYEASCYYDEVMCWWFS